MQTLSEIYRKQGKALPMTVEERFKDSNFAAAAQQAGITKDQYAVNQGNAVMNTAIANLYGKTATSSQPTVPATTAQVNTQNEYITETRIDGHGQPYQVQLPNPNFVKTSQAPAVTQPKQPVTPATAYKDINVPTGSFEDQNVTSARKAQLDYINSLQQPDENQIYQNTLAKFQAEIDATNRMYADELARAKTAGQGRLGTQTAMTGRRGLIGSDFGEAQIQGQEQANEQVYGSIENERLAKVNQILTQAKQDATAEMRAKRDAYVSGLDARLEYYNQATERKANNTNKAVAALLAQGVTLKDIDPTQLSQLAKYYGITVDDIKANYDVAKKAEDEKKSNLIAKDQPATVQEYEYAKANGYTGSFTEYQNEDANRKAVSSGSSLTPYQQFQATQSISKDVQARTQAAREISRQSQLITSSYNNIVNGGDKSLNTQAIITAFNKILDPTSVVREGEYDRTAEGQSLISRLQGKVENISKGGSGVTTQTLKEAADIANTYLQKSQNTIDSENERARQMAEQFGLNSSFVGSVNAGTVDNSNTGNITTIKTKVGNLDLSTW